MILLISIFWAWTSFSTMERHVAVEGQFPTWEKCEAQRDRARVEDEDARYICVEVSTEDARR